MARGLWGTNSFFENNRTSSNTSTTDIREYGEEIARLKGQVERLNLLTEALWCILKKEGYTDDDLHQTLSELDTNKKRLKKARENGEPEEEDAPRLCPNCHVPLQNTDLMFDRCIYCGHEIIADPFK